MDYSKGKFPQQQLPMSRKTKAWRKAHLDWAEDRSFFNWSPVRNSVSHMKINYDLFNDKLHMKDLVMLIDPEGIDTENIPEKIQHYPIANSKIRILQGEENKRVFDFKIVVTNPNSISEIENNKRDMVLQQLQQLVQATSMDENQMNQKLEKMSDYFMYEWQDMREVRANNLIHHYIKEYNLPLVFNAGFMDACIAGEEIYQIDIVGGEPVVNRLNPLKVRVFKSGYSNRIEDADVIVIEDYWAPGRIYDTFYDAGLTKKDIDYIESAADITGDDDGMDHPSQEFVSRDMIGEEIVFPSDDGLGFYFDPFGMFSEGNADGTVPFDTNGNVRVIRMYWKSRRKIKKVKSYNPETGEEMFNFYDETYVIDEARGEEEEIYYINEAWEGTKIGEKVYVNIRPRVVQYNRLSNPSRCHFGIIGSIYNINDSKPVSMMDMMKPYNYFYDVIHDRLSRIIAHNWGKIIQLDLAKVPEGWNIDKWMYYAKKNNLAVVNSFNIGNEGAAKGVLAGGLNNASSGVIDAEVGNSIQMYINILEFIKLSMSEIVGITKQREGQVSNRETVGGVERATLQSSHITEWVFSIHDDVKKRVLECLLETAKICYKGGSKKFQYITSDGAQMVADIDGDEFAESDYGLVVDYSNSLQELNQKLDMLAQAALQNQMISFSTVMKLYNSSSLLEKQKLVERDEAQMRERNAQAQQEQMQLQQQQMEAQAAMQQAQMEQNERMNMRDNETKLLVATINSADDGIQEPEYSQESKEKLEESIRQFNEKIKLDREKLAFEKQKNKDNNDVKLQIARMKPRTTAN